MELAYYSLIAGACILALANWRWGLYAGVLLDVLRDPVRKISEEQSVVITLAGALVWGISLLSAIAANQNEWRQIFRRYRQFHTVGMCVALAVVPAALLSIMLYSRGYVLAVMGTASYIAPLCAIAMGFIFIRSDDEVYRLLRFYSVINALSLMTVPLEYFGVDIPGLGGINTTWIRYRAGDLADVKLIAGWYRSPDIMGLHAAHVMMFSSMLAVRSRSSARVGWIVVLLWAGYCLLLCGRRKMVGIPIVFLGSYFLIGAFRGMHQMRRLVGLLLSSVLLATAVGVIVWDNPVSTEYADYAATIFTESHTRFNELVVGSAIGTLQQAGILGAGLGTATQGRYYMNVNAGLAARGWQEDGLSKMLLEFGLPGLLLMLTAAVALVAALLRAMQLVHRTSSVQTMQVGLMSVVLGDAASFIVSHQQFSGDPVSGMLVMIMVGMVLGAPRAFARQQMQHRRVDWSGDGGAPSEAPDVQPLFAPAARRTGVSL